MSLLSQITTWLRVTLESLCQRYGLPLLVVDLLAWVAAVAVIIGFVLLIVLIFVYLERKVSGYIQTRLGPMRVGPIGIFQTAMDALKLLSKEDIVPRGADKILHTLGPILFFVTAMLGYVVIPWDAKATIAQHVDANIGILYVIAVGSVGIIGIIMGGWGSNNKWSLLGAIRSAAQMVSYEIPMLLAIICVVMQAESIALGKIVADQQGAYLTGWYCWRPWLWLPLILFFIAATAEVNRVPFDIPEAESELVAGYHTEYSGMKFALFFLAEYANVFVVGLIGATLFFGGWLSPLGHPDPLHIPGFFWLMAKALAIVIFLIWVRWTLPRLRVDQLMALAWKLLLPAGFLAIFIVAVVLLYL